jgi:hypothetical protein
MYRDHMVSEALKSQYSYLPPGTSYNFGCWFDITAILWASPVTESVALPPLGEHLT